MAIQECITIVKILTFIKDCYHSRVSKRVSCVRIICFVWLQQINYCSTDCDTHVSINYGDEYIELADGIRLVPLDFAKKM